MNVPPGAYTLVVMYVGYAETRVENVTVTGADGTTLHGLLMKPPGFREG